MSLIDELFGLVPASLFVFDERETLVEVHGRAAQACIGQPLEALTGRSFTEVFSELPWVLDGFERWTPKGEMASVDGIARGRFCWVRIAARRDAGGAYAGFLVPFFDVTERKGKLDAEFDRALSLLHATLDATDDAILTVDVDKRVGFVNQRFLEMWNLPESVMRHPDVHVRLASILDQLVDPAGYVARTERDYAHPEIASFATFHFKDGRTVERYSHPQWVGDRCVGRVLSFRDITKQRRAEAERDRLLAEEKTARAAAEAAEVRAAQLYEQAQAALQLREDFLSIASHELRTPLSSLKLNVQGLLHFSKDGTLPLSDEMVRRALENIERQISRLSALVGSLLDVQRMSADRFDLEPSESDLRRLASDVIAALAVRIERAGSRVELIAPAQLIGTWDGARIEQVLMNLLSNALAHCEQRPVEVCMERMGDRAIIKVRDHGSGIAAEFLPRLFEKFERGASARGYGGLGLGLYIVRQIVEAHGGSVAVESTVGRGSTFTLSLPTQPR